MSSASSPSSPSTLSAAPGPANPSASRSEAAGARRPHPGIPVLLGIHLHSLVREFPVAWLLFGGMAVGLPLLAIFMELAPSGPEANFGLVQVLSGLFVLQSVTVLVAVWWPDAVWRNLPPGRRRVMDALPVSRRSHRLARVLAGFTLPLLLAISAIATGSILLSRLSSAEISLAQSSRVILAGNFGVGLLAVGATYLFGSALALRGWRVILVTLLLLVVYAFVPLGLLMGLGWDEAANRYIETMVRGDLSPVRVLMLGLRAGGSDLLPVLAWLVGLGFLCTHWARRHDRV